MLSTRARAAVVAEDLIFQQHLLGDLILPRRRDQETMTTTARKEIVYRIETLVPLENIIFATYSGDGAL